MRIVHIIRTLNPAWGGPVEGVKNLSTAAHTAGVQVAVTCLDDPNAPWLSSWQVPVHAVGPARGTFGYTQKLNEWLTEHLHEYDAVLVHGIWMYFGSAARKSALQNHIPYYVFIHGALDPWFKHRYPLKHIKKLVYWRLVEHRVLRDANAVFFTTEEERILAENAFRPYKCNPVVIGYGICSPPLPDTQAATKPAAERPSSPPPPVNCQPFLGRIHEKKGVDLLINAFSSVKDLRPDLTLMIAGPGKPDFLERLQTLASKLGIADRIRWAGALYGDAKWNAIRGADAFILPSHQENFGISVVECLACGIPVLISNKVNIWREVSREGAGLIESDTVEGTTKLLSNWIALSPDQKKKMAAEARNCFGAHFNIVNTSRHYLSMIRMHEQQRPCSS
jgi:glycosyltransferase involved in cell wall biosynthesis